jgi:hypothetical protein
MSQYVPIKLDKIRNLRIGIKATKIIEDVLKQPISKVVEKDMGINELNVILYAGLVHEDKQLTVDKVLDLMDEYSNIQEISESISKAMEIGFGTADPNVPVGK